jgi:hypothetical protein
MNRIIWTALGLVLAAPLGAAAQDEALPKKWNAWLESRLYNINDAVTQQRSLGKNVTVGLDARALDWLTVGLGLAYEAFDTKTGAANLPTFSTGVGVQPYATARLSPNLFLTGFGGLSHIDYETAITPGQHGSFDAWRWLVGASLSGRWQDGGWRFQPTATVIHGAENQRAYTSSTGGFFPAQRIEFGRISLGPEIGYAFSDDSKAWALEPFVNLRGNFDYIPNTVAVFNGASFLGAGRSQWSAAAAVGAALNTKQGFSSRLQFSHESLGLNGLDIWLAQFRATWNF